VASSPSEAFLPPLHSSIHRLAPADYCLIYGAIDTEDGCLAYTPPVFVVKVAISLAVCEVHESFL